MKPLRIYSKTDLFYKVFLTVFISFFALIHFFIWKEEEIDAAYWIFFGISIFICSFLAVLPKITYFQFNEDHLKCHTLFFVTKNIPYQGIRKLEKSKYIYAGLKFSTSLKGWILSYDKYDDILISPKDEQLFIQELLKRNDKIEIVES